MGCHGNYHCTEPPPPPGRDAELQQAFVVIKTECQAEEGWQWIKASFACESTCISWESHRFHVPRRLCLRFKWLCFVLVNVPPQHQIQAAARGGLSSLIWPSSHLIGCKAWRRRTLCRPRWQPWRSTTPRRSASSALSPDCAAHPQP